MGFQDKLDTFVDNLKTQIPVEMAKRRRLASHVMDVDVSASQSSDMCTGDECDDNAAFAPGGGDDDDDDDDGSGGDDDDNVAEAAAGMPTVHIASAVTLMVTAFAMF